MKKTALEVVNSMYERIKVSKINNHIWLLNDHDEATGYLITGEKRGLIIDTMYGREDVKKVAEELTNFPLSVVNTHGHWDHVYGNIYFEEVYIHQADISIASHYFERTSFQKMIRKKGLKPARFATVAEGDAFDLGGIVLDIYEVPGHTPGGIVLLDRKDRILFTGDSIIEQTWMQLPDSLPMESFLSSLQKVQKLRSEFDYVLTGHGRGLEDASLCEAHIKAVEEVCQGKTEKDEPYQWYGGECMAHPYGKEPRRIAYNKSDL